MSDFSSSRHYGEEDAMTRSRLPVPAMHIEQIILVIRGMRVILDADLAHLYSVSVKRLNEAVKRNRGRFPEDFMFQLSWEEATSLRSQFATLKRGKHRKFRPYVFTEQGVAMLSSVLHSPRAIRVNIEIMRAFVRLRGLLTSNAELARKLENLETKCNGQFQVVFEAIRQLMAPPVDPPKELIGFKPRH